MPLASMSTRSEKITTPTPSLNNDSPAITNSSSFGAPADLRMPFKILRNAGILPPEAELRKEIFALSQELRSAPDGESRGKKLRELNAKILQLNEMMKRPFCQTDFSG